MVSKTDQRFLLFRFLFAALPAIILYSCKETPAKPETLASMVSLNHKTVISRPFGMVQISPLKVKTGKFEGFSNLPADVTPVDLRIIPSLQVISYKEKGLSSSNPVIPLSFEQEKTEVGRYTVLLDDRKIKADVTATERAGFYQFSFPNDTLATICFRFNSTTKDPTAVVEFRTENSNLLTGSYIQHTVPLRQIFFAIQFSKPFRRAGFIRDGEVISPADSISGKANTSAFVCFSTKYETNYKLKAGFSTASIDGAHEDLKREINGWTFDNYVADLNFQWESLFRKITLGSDNKQLISRFYTELFYNSLRPSLLSDYYSQYLSQDGSIRISESYKFYNMNPVLSSDENRLLFDILQINQKNDFIQSLCAESGIKYDTTMKYLFISEDLFPEKKHRTAIDSGAVSLIEMLGLKISDYSRHEIQVVYPSFKKYQIQMNGNTQLRVDFRNFSPYRKTIGPIMFNGKLITGKTLSEEQLIEGGELIITPGN